MRITESKLRSIIRSVIKENSVGGDVEGSIKVRGLNVFYELVDYDGECELKFTVQNSSESDLLEKLIKLEAEKCGLEPDVYGSSQSIAFTVEDMFKAKKCMEQILDYLKKFG